MTGSARPFDPWSACRAVGLILSAALAAAGEATVVAVCPLTKGATTEVVARAFEDGLSEGLSARGFDLVERSRIAAVLAEQALGVSGAIDDAGAARIGRLLAVDVLVVGSARAGAGDAVRVALRAVRIADGRIAWAGEAAGEPAAVAAQSAGLAEDCAAALARADNALVTGERRALGALKHHERAQALAAAGQHEDAACEELLALREDDALPGAEEGFLRALADGGFPEIAGAEASAAIATGRVDKDSPIARLAAARIAATKRTPSASPPLPEAPPIVAYLERLAKGDDEVARLARADLAAAWFDVAKACALANLDRQASAASREAFRRWAAACHADPWLLTTEVPRDRGIALEPGLRALDRVYVYRSIGGFADTSAWLDHDLPRELADAIAAGFRLDGVAAPPPIEVMDLPILDRAKVGEDVVLRLDCAPLADGVLLAASLLRGEQALAEGGWSIAAVQQKWIGAEADAWFARTGRRWLGGQRGYRPMATSAEFNRLVHGIRAQAADGAAALGLVMRLREETGPLAGLHLRVAVTGRRGAGEACAASLLGQGVVAILAGDRARAREAFALLRGKVQVGASRDLDALIALAEEP